MRKISQQKTRAVALRIRVRTFTVVSLMVAVLLSSYVALVGLSVKNVIVRKEAETKAAYLRAKVSEMEREYIVRVGDISEARAEGIGLAKIESKSFTERKVLVGQAY